MDVDSITSLSRGATFFRGDLHIHSFGASHDVQDSSATPERIVEVAVSEGLRIIALADHNEISNIRDAVAHGSAKGCLVIPGVELSTPEGHLLCYAPNADALEGFFNRLSIQSRRTSACRCQTGTVECLNILRSIGGFAILAHVELPGAFESNMPRLTPAKLDILCHSALAGIEVTRADCPILYNDTDTDSDRRSVAVQRRERLHLGSQQSLARVLNSDAHTLNAVGRNAKSDQRITRYKMEQPSFEGLKIALSAADTRVRIEDEVPDSIAIIAGVHFSGCFLDDQAIHFSPNLTCIIGGRGSGKSTAFEGLRLVAGPDPEDEKSVIDSDVWPDCLSLIYRDETQQDHLLSRDKRSPMENVEDPVTGSTRFPVESYRQGETNEISKRVQSDPLALLTFLDRLIDVEDAISVEDSSRAQLNELAPKLKEARGNVARIPEFEREMRLKQDQVARLKKDRAEDVIKLQQKLEGEKRARMAVEAQLSQLSGKISHEAISAVIKGIKDSVGQNVIELGAPEAAQIKCDTDLYESEVVGSTTALKQVTEAYANKVRAQILAWKGKEAHTTSEIEAKKKELLDHGIKLDMLFIQSLVANEAKAVENVRILKTWVPELQRLQAEHARILRERWNLRTQVANCRTSFATLASNALKGTLSDLFVTLKFEVSSLSPDAEAIISQAMGWRTLQQLKAAALIKNMTLPLLLDCVRRRSKKEFMALLSDKGGAVFDSNEAGMLIERLSEPDILAQLESIAVYDLPKLSVTKRVEGQGKPPKYVPRDFSKLSLGQQQSVLLALMLTSKSRAPLIVDQPEDNLDSEFIYKTLVPVIRAAKERRQIIVVTHNANIAVLGDAEQIVVLKATNDKALVVARGSIDEPQTNAAACAILEGSPEAFERRARIYGIAIT